MISLLSGLFGSNSFALKPGDTLPEIKAMNQDGKEVNLKALRGKPILVYFYPKDDTPGCTKEACLLRDYYDQFAKAGAVILGVSRQDAQSHQKFRKKHNLPFDLLVDEDGQVAKAMGIELYPVVGLHKRESILIDREGKIFKNYKDVSPEAHASEVLKDIKEMDTKRSH